MKVFVAGFIKSIIISMLKNMESSYKHSLYGKIKPCPNIFL